MKVFVLSADTTTDVSGEIISSGYVVGAYTSEKSAEEKIKQIGDTYARKMWEYTIDEVEVK